jgi:hypothetical protein
MTEKMTLDDFPTAWMSDEAAAIMTDEERKQAWWNMLGDRMTGSDGVAYVPVPRRDHARCMVGITLVPVGFLERDAEK